MDGHPAVFPGGRAEVLHFGLEVPEGAVPSVGVGPAGPPIPAL